MKKQDKKCDQQCKNQKIPKKKIKEYKKMSFIDDIINIFNNKKTKTNIQTKKLNKIYKDNNEPFQARLTNNNGDGLPDKIVRFVVNNVTYERNTDTNGIATLNMNLNVGSYSIDVFFDGDESYQPSTARNTVLISPKLSSNDLKMTYGDTAYFNVKCTDVDNNPINGCGVAFTVNGVTYNRTSNEQGVASLKIGLATGSYKIVSKSYNTSIENTITVAEKPKTATRMEGTDINKTASETAVYQCAVYANNQRIAVPVNIIANGKTYTKTPDSEGLCKLNINLAVGDYTITSEFTGNSEYTGSKVTNKIHVEKDPEKPKCNNPYSSSPFHLTQGGGQLGQKTAYSCGPHALMQAYYNLTGIDTSESELMSACGTTTSGTSHQGLASGLAWLNKKYGTNVTMEWKDFSDVGYTKLGELLCDSDSSIFWHELYRSQWGHYSLANKINTSTSLFNVLNSLGSKCNSPAYCGYQESRGFSTQKAYWNGISQKSICILRRK